MAEMKGLFQQPKVTLSSARYDRFRCEKNILSPVAPMEQQVYGVISAQRIRTRGRHAFSKIPRKNKNFPLFIPLALSGTFIGIGMFIGIVDVEGRRSQ
jgi:hypothetical protein